MPLNLYLPLSVIVQPQAKGYCPSHYHYTPPHSPAPSVHGTTCLQACVTAVDNESWRAAWEGACICMHALTTPTASCQRGSSHAPRPLFGPLLPSQKLPHYLSGLSRAHTATAQGDTFDGTCSCQQHRCLLLQLLLLLQQQPLLPSGWHSGVPAAAASVTSPTALLASLPTHRLGNRGQGAAAAAAASIQRRVTQHPAQLTSSAVKHGQHSPPRYMWAP